MESSQTKRGWKAHFGPCTSINPAGRRMRNLRRSCSRWTTVVDPDRQRVAPTRKIQDKFSNPPTTSTSHLITSINKTAFQQLTTRYNCFKLQNLLENVTYESYHNLGQTFGSQCFCNPTAFRATSAIDPAAPGRHPPLSSPNHPLGSLNTVQSDCSPPIFIQTPSRVVCVLIPIPISFAVGYYLAGFYGKASSFWNVWFVN